MSELKPCPFPPEPDSLWLVLVECRYDVVHVSVSGKGFYIPGQEPCWGFDHVTKWIQQINPINQSLLERDLLAAQSALKICGEASKGVAEFNRHNDDCYSQKTSPTTYSDPMASTCDCGLREAFIKYQESLSVPALKQAMEK